MALPLVTNPKQKIKKPMPKTLDEIRCPFPGSLQQRLAVTICNITGSSGSRRHTFNPSFLTIVDRITLHLPIPRPIILRQLQSLLLIKASSLRFQMVSRLHASSLTKLVYQTHLKEHFKPLHYKENWHRID